MFIHMSQKGCILGIDLEFVKIVASREQNMGEKC